MRVARSPHHCKIRAKSNIRRDLATGDSLGHRRGDLPGANPLDKGLLGPHFDRGTRNRGDFNSFSYLRLYTWLLIRRRPTLETSWTTYCISYSRVLLACCLETKCLYLDPWKRLNTWSPPSHQAQILYSTTI